MKTRQLYIENSYEIECQSTVSECTLEDGYYQVVLDKTVFFPEGGGQYGDRGTIDDVKVLDTQIKDGIVYHKTEEPIQVGKEVVAKIDWERRYEMMQNHSSEHMISGFVHQIYGYDNVGFHLGEEEMTLDFNGVLSKEDIEKLEEKVNEYIWKDIPIIISFPTKEELETLPYRSKKEIDGDIRIVTVEDVDICACCAPHVKTTGEIGCVKIISVQKNKGGVRLTALAGKRAMNDYGKKHNILSQLTKLCSAKGDEIIEIVEKLQKEKQQLQYELSQCRFQLWKEEVKSLPVEDGIAWIQKYNVSSKELRELANWLMERGTIGIAIGKAEETSSSFQYVIGSKEIDVKAFSQDILAQFDAKGGGQPQMIQGNGVGDVETLIAHFGQKMKQDKEVEG